MEQKDDRDVRDRLIRLEERQAATTEDVKGIRRGLLGVAALVLTAVGKSLLAAIGLGGN